MHGIQSEQCADAGHRGASPSDVHGIQSEQCAWYKPTNRSYTNSTSREQK